VLCGHRVVEGVWRLWLCGGAARRSCPLVSPGEGGAALLFGRVIDTSWVLRPRGARPWHCGWRWFPSPSVRLP